MKTSALTDEQLYKIEKLIMDGLTFKRISDHMKIPKYTIENLASTCGGVRNFSVVLFKELKNPLYPRLSIARIRNVLSRLDFGENLETLCKEKHTSKDTVIRCIEIGQLMKDLSNKNKTTVAECIENKILDEILFVLRNIEKMIGERK